MATARAAGWQVWSATPTVAESDFPWTGLAQLLDGVEPRSLDALTRGRARQLKFATSAVRGEAIVPEVVAFGLEALLDNAADGRSKPLLIAIDDVQWIDTQTAGALAYALRGTPTRHSIAVLAQRTGEQSPIEATRGRPGVSRPHPARRTQPCRAPRGPRHGWSRGPRARRTGPNPPTHGRQSDVRDRAGPLSPARLVLRRCEFARVVARHRRRTRASVASRDTPSARGRCPHGPTVARRLGDGNARARRAGCACAGGDERRHRSLASVAVRWLTARGVQPSAARHRRDRRPDERRAATSPRCSRGDGRRHDRACNPPDRERAERATRRRPPNWNEPPTTRSVAERSIRR